MLTSGGRDSEKKNFDNFNNTIHIVDAGVVKGRVGRFRIFNVIIV